MKSPEGGSRMSGIATATRPSTFGMSRPGGNMEPVSLRIPGPSSDIFRMPAFSPPPISSMTSESPVRMGSSIFERTKPFVAPTAPVVPVRIVKPARMSPDTFSPFRTRKDASAGSKRPVARLGEAVRTGPDNSVKNTKQYKNISDSVTTRFRPYRQYRQEPFGRKVADIQSQSFNKERIYVPKPAERVLRLSTLAPYRLPTPDRVQETRKSISHDVLQRTIPFPVAETPVMQGNPRPLSSRETVQKQRTIRIEEIQKELRSMANFVRPEQPKAVFQLPSVPLPSQEANHDVSKISIGILSDRAVVTPLPDRVTAPHSYQRSNTLDRLFPKTIESPSPKANAVVVPDVNRQNIVKPQIQTARDVLVQRQQKMMINMLNNKEISKKSSEKRKRINRPFFQKDVRAAKAFIMAGKDAWNRLVKVNKTGNALANSITVNKEMISELAKQKNVVDGSIAVRISALKNQTRIYSGDVENVLHRSVKDIPPVAPGMGEQVTDTDIKRVLNGNYMKKIEGISATPQE